MARPRKQDALNIRERAVAAAMALLQGDAAVTLGAVAHHVGCSAPALYAHFRDKDDLLRAVQVAAFAQTTREKIARYGTSDDDPVASLRAGGHRFVAFAEGNPRLYRLLYAPDHDSEGIAIPEAALAALSAGVRAAQRVGFAAAAPPRAVAELLWFTVHGAIMMALDSQLAGPVDARWSRAHRAVDTVVALLGPRAAAPSEAVTCP